MRALIDYRCKLKILFCRNLLVRFAASGSERRSESNNGDSEGGLRAVGLICVEEFTLKLVKNHKKKKNSKNSSTLLRILAVVRARRVKMAEKLNMG